MKITTLALAASAALATGCSGYGPEADRILYRTSDRPSPVVEAAPAEFPTGPAAPANDM